MKNKIFTLFTLLLLSNLYFGQTFTLNSALSGTTISTCSGTFVDDGGSTGDYTEGQIRTVTFCPGTAGDAIKVTFTALSLKLAGNGDCEDVLDVYQGDAAYAAPLIALATPTPDDRLCGALTGTNLPVFYSTSASGCITFHFIDNGNKEAAGWAATISCYTPCKNPMAALVNSSNVTVCGPNSNTPGSLSVNFDASNSTVGAYGAGGSTVTIGSYTWDFGDGTIVTNSSANFNHSYPNAPGVYIMRLKVTDNNMDASSAGCSSVNSITRVIRILPAPTFTASTNSPQNIGCGSNATLTGVAKSQTETQSIPSVSGVTVSLPDGSGSSAVSGADFSGFFPTGATMTSGCYPTLWFRLEHSFAGDLYIDLIAPSGETVRVYNRNGGATNFGTCSNGADDGVAGCGQTYSVSNAGTLNFNLVSSVTTATSSCAGFAGPCEAGNNYLNGVFASGGDPFSNLNGASMNGVWQIKVTDNQLFDDGFLFGWGLVFPPSCYTPLETITPSLTNATWTSGGSGTAVPGSQTTTSIAVTDPGPDACPTVGTCTGNQLTNTINFGPFNTPGTYPYLYTATDQFGCTYTNTVSVAVSCTCPSLTAISYGGPFCQSLTSTHTPTVSGSGAISSGSYSSTPVGLSINATSGIITPSLSTANNYTVTYSVAATGTCSAISINTVVTINATPTIAVNSATICSGTSTVLTASGGTTYSWTPGTDLSAITGSIVTASPTITIVYTVTGTTNGCSSTNTSTVTVNETPTITVNSPTICSGTSTVLTASGGAIGTTYTWSPGTNLSVTTGSVVTASPTTTIEYTVTATLNGCSGAATSTVSVNATPTITVNSPTICSGTSTVLTANGGAVGATYTWSPGTNLSVTTGSVVTASPTTAIQYTVTATLNGCSGSKTSTVTVNATPTITVNSPTICSGTSTVLTANGGAVGTSYTWSPNTNLSITTGSVVTASPTVPIQYTVTATLNGCSGAATSTVTVNSIPTTSASTNGTISCATPTIALTSTLSGMSYTWTAPSGGSVTAANTQNTSAFGGPGTYSLLVRSVAGCVFSTTTSVTQNTVAPSGFTAGSNQTLTCGNPSVTLTGIVGIPANSTLNWTGPNVCGTPTTIVTSACGAGIYTLTATDPINGCTQIANVTVSPSAGSPSVTANAPSNSITCTNTVVTISVSTTVAAVSYTWSGTGIATGNGTGTITVTQGGIFIYSVTAGGCTTSGNITVQTNTTVPTTTASTSGIITCSTPTIDLNSTLAGMSYTWTAPAGGNIESGNVNTQNTTVYGAQGTYSLFVIDPTNDCSYTATLAVTQNTTVPTTVASTTGTLTCVTSTVSLNSNSTGMTYTWTAPSGGTVNPVNTETTVASGVTGDYTVTIVDLTNGCTFTTTTLVTENITIPTGVSAGSNQILTCPANMVTLTGNLTAPSDATINWTGADVCGTATTIVTSACAAGDYTLTVTDPLNGCETASVVTVFPNIGPPTATISATSLIIDCNNPVQSVTVTSTPSADVIYNWNITPFSASADSSSAIFNNDGTYIATVTNTLSNCSIEVSVVISENTALPTTVASTTGTLNCVTSNVSLNANLIGMTYTWTAPSGGTVNSPNAETTVASGVAGDYTLTVVDVTNGCTFTTTTLVTENINPPTIDIITTGIITSCVTLTVNLSTTVTGMTYSWTAPIGGSVSTPTDQSTVASGIGDYTLTIIDPLNGCPSSSVTSVIQNTVAPTLTVSPMSYTLACGNPTVQLIATTTDTDVDYEWSPVASLDNNIISNPIATGSGTYNVIVTNSLTGCYSNATATISPNAGAPTASITATSLILDCNNPVQSVTVTSTPSTDVTYNWNITPFSASADSSSATFNNDGTYIATVTNTLSTCSETVQVIVTSDMTAPTISITPTSQSLTCAAGTATLYAIPFPTTSITYTWTGIGVTGQTTSSVEVNSQDIYTVSITNAANGCTNTAVSAITSDTNVPIATITVTPTNSVITCQNSSVTLSVTVLPADTYTYTWSSGGTGITENVTAPIGYTVTVVNSSGCTASAPYTVTANTTPPNIVVANTVIPCGSPSVAIEAIVTPANINYTWTTSGTGSILSVTDMSTAVAGSAGQYVVTAMDNDNGCMDTRTVTVTSTGITAGFTANPLSGTAPLLVNFTNQGPVTLNYSWTFGDNNNNTAISTDASHTYTATGNYVVTLVATDASSLCSATATLSIEVFENATLIVPNVFTPNGDGSNDLFKVISTGMKDLTCDIFNRWGTKIYTIKTVNDSWDGSGADDGTYFFILEAKGIDGKEFKQQGYISLFR